MPVKLAARAVWQDVRPAFVFFLPFFYLSFLFEGWLEYNFDISTFIIDVIQEQAVIKTTFLMYILIMLFYGIAFTLRSASRMCSNRISVVLQKLSECMVGICNSVVALANGTICVLLCLMMAVSAFTVTSYYVFATGHFTRLDVAISVLASVLGVLLIAALTVSYQYFISNYEDNIVKHSAARGIFIGLVITVLFSVIMFLTVSQIPSFACN